VAAAPERFFVPPCVGHEGWIGVHFGPPTDRAEVMALARRAWRLTTPKRLAVQAPDDG
jgi:hypothetical protein